MRTITRYCLLVVALWLASIPAAEGVFRMLGDETSADLAGLYAPFEGGSYKLAPSVDTDAHWSAGRFSVHTDVLGLRSDRARHFASQPGDRLDVLLLGDSQGFGNGLGFEDSLAGGIVTVAATGGYRVSNASVGGHGLLNQLSVMKWLRDVQHVTARHYVFLMTPVMIANGASFARATVGDDGRLYQRALSPIGKSTIWIKTHAVVYSRIRDAVRNYGIGTTPEAGSAMVFQIYGSAGNADQVSTRFTATMKAVRDFASQTRATVQIVYVPLTVEIDSANLEQAAAARSIALDLDAPFRLCREVASRLEIPVIDLRPVLRKLHEERRPLNLRADFHYNEELSRRSVASLWPQLQRSFQQPSADTRIEQ